MRIVRATLIGVILLAGSLSLRGQYQDFQVWSSAAVRAQITPRLRISLEEEARFFENISRFDKLNSDLTLDYKLFDNVRVRMLYRLILNGRRDGSYELKHRFSPAIGYQTQKGPWNIELFAKFQTTWEDFNRSEEWYIPRNYVRLEGEVSRQFNRNRTEPYASLEFWYYMPPGDPSFFDQYRLTLGVKHKLSPVNRIQLYYRIQQEINVKDPLFAHVIGVGYLFIWKP